MITDATCAPFPNYFDSWIAAHETKRGSFDAVAQRESKASEPPAAHPSATTSSVSQVLEADGAESLIFTVGSKDSNSGKE